MSARAYSIGVAALTKGDEERIGMRVLHRVRRIAISAVLLTITLTAQHAVKTPVNALRSPEVHTDRTVTLRFAAPQATGVELTGEINMGKGPRTFSQSLANWVLAEIVKNSKGKR
jgi:hypothetical protein